MTRVSNTLLPTNGDGVLKVDNVSGGGATSDATAANQVLQIANQTNGTQLSKVMGSQDGTITGTQKQLKVASDGALHIISENYDSMLIKGVDNDATGVQRDCRQNSNGDLRVQLLGNDGDDGSGAIRIVKCDTNGLLQVNSINEDFGTVVVLKDDETIGNVGSFAYNTTGKKGQKVSLQIISNGGTTDWTCVINQSLRNSNWSQTHSNINAVPAVSQIVEINVIAPYWSLVFSNTGISSSNWTIKYV